MGSALFGEPILRSYFAPRSTVCPFASSMTSMLPRVALEWVSSQPSAVSFPPEVIAGHGEQRLGHLERQCDTSLDAFLGALG
jgi:hypothetical protein